jgi:hypothetical protein
VRVKVGGAAVAVAAILYLMLDSRVFTAEPAAPATSAALGILALLFGLGAWANTMGQQSARAPLLAGLAAGTGTYALVRLIVF